MLVAIPMAQEELEHALTYLQPVKRNGNTLSLDVPIDDQFLEYTQDLIEYGLIRYVIDNGDENGFKLWQNYRMDQVQLKLLNNPRKTEGGTGTYLFDIHMENALPEYLQYDFGLTKE